MKKSNYLITNTLYRNEIEAECHVRLVAFVIFFPTDGLSSIVTVFSPT